LGLKLNGIDQLLAHADDERILGDSIVTIKKNIETWMVDSKVACLEVNSRNTNSKLISPHQNEGQNHYIKISERTFESVAQFKHLGMTVTNQKMIQVELQKRLDSSNTCYQSFLNLSFSYLLYKN
jgi:hypothetical protein